MDFLAGYGPGSESDSDGGGHDSLPASTTVQSSLTAVQGSTAAAPAGAGGLFGSLPRPKNAAPAADGARKGASGLPVGFFDSDPTAAGAAEEAPSGLPAGFFDAAPAVAAPAAAKPPAQPDASVGAVVSGSAGAQLFSKLPAASKRKVLLRPKIDLQLLAQQSDSDDDEPVAKKIKAAAPAAGKPSVLSFLPAPKHAAAGKRMDVGAGTNSSSFAEAQQRKQQQQQEEEEQQRAVQAAAVGPQAPASNEMYRMRPAAVAATAADAYQQQFYGQHEQQYAQQEYAAAGAYGSYDGSVQQQPQQQRQQQYQQLAPEEAFLQEALQAEASKAARRAAGAGTSQLVMPDIQFKEIKADEVKYVDPAHKEAAQGMRSALGTDYAQQLRSQAAPHMGSKLARSKHQIGTLFASAKLHELEVMENRAGGMKTKAETAGKYGWS